MLAKLPQPCFLCADDHGNGTLLCRACASTIPTLQRSCPRCAEPQFSDDLCNRCQQQLPPIDDVIAGGLYQWPVAQLVQRLKFGHDLLAGRALAELVENQAQQQAESPDLLIPMPLHWRRRWSRGFNQAAELAIQIGQRLDIAVELNAITRQRATNTQSKLTAAQRRRNLQGAFTLNKRAKPTLRGKHIAIVDDVMTTGSSAYAVAKLLRTAKPKHISVWVAARAGQNH